MVMNAAPRSSNHPMDVVGEHACTDPLCKTCGADRPRIAGGEKSRDLTLVPESSRIAEALPLRALGRAEDCDHVAWAPISLGGTISGASRSGLRTGVGDVRWCTYCGALQGVVGNRVSPWMLPGSLDAARALETLRWHLAGLAEGSQCASREARADGAPADLAARVRLGTGD